MPRRNSYTAASPIVILKKSFLLADDHHNSNNQLFPPIHDQHENNNGDNNSVHSRKEMQHVCTVAEHHHPFLHQHNNNNDSYDEAEDLDVTNVQEMNIVLKLSIQGMVSQLGWSVPSFLLASYIGRNFGPIYLDGYSLAMLTGNLCILSFLESIFSAITTLTPQAYGSKNYAELQLITIRGFILCLIVVSIFAIVLSFYIKEVLVVVGEDPIAAQYAEEWYRIYSLSLPFYALYHMTNCFLAAQYIVMPEVITALVSSICILPILVMVLGSTNGYIGTSYSVVIYQAFQAFLLLAYLRWKKPYHPETWQSIDSECIKNIFDWKPLSNLLWLGGGAMLAGSEWIYWEVLSLIVGTLGVTQLTVHMIATQIITVTYMIPLGVSEAISIRLGNTIPQSASKAKTLSFWYLISALVLMTIVSLCTYIFRSSIYQIFTKEEDIIQGCEEIWSKVCMYIFTIGIWAIMEGITTSIGRQWIVGVLVVILLWSISLPLLYYLAIVKNGGLNVAWQCVWPPNFILIIFLAVYLSRLDWDVLSAEARMDESDDDEDDYSNASEIISITKKTKDKNGFYGSISQEETASLSI